MPFDRDRMSARAGELAARGVYVGTSSWKYEGWINQLYTPERYAYRGGLARSRFDRSCLGEYAQVFKTVCVDAAYYAFPGRTFLQRMADQAPEDFLFGLKVTDTITIKKFPNLERFGDRAGKANDQFLDADLFAKAFLEPCEAIRPKVGLLIFEFSRFWPTDYGRGRDFLADLDMVLGRLPGGWPYGVELRNSNWLHRDYFECLSRRRVAHVFNSWGAMPPVGEQLSLPQSRTHAELVGARFLLTPGRRYEEAVQRFQPYDKIKEVNEEARAAGAALISEGAKTPGRKTFIYVNNRLEGNSVETLDAMVGLARIPHDREDDNEIRALPSTPLERGPR